MSFQEKILLDTTYLRIKYPLPPYPCYHSGLYLEEYFCNYFIKNCLNKKYDRHYLPIFWTNIYLKNWIHNYKNPVIQCYLNTIPKNEKYFTVCQHDDAPTEKIDHLDMVVYSAGGNYNKGIPIPLVCSPIPEKYKQPLEKSIFCSFVGSNTHSVRAKTIKHLKEDNDFFISSKEWNYQVKNNEFDFFIETTKKSVFTICARGYGKQSYRFYEAIQLGSIPVYIYDDEPYLPFANSINYDNFSIVLNVEHVKDLKDILKSKTKEDIENMVRKGKEIYNEYFTLQSVTDRILNSLEK